MSNDLPTDQIAVARLLEKAKPGDTVMFSHAGCRIVALARADAGFCVVCATHEQLIEEQRFDAFSAAIRHSASAAARTVEASIMRCRSCGVQLIVKSVSCDRCGEVVGTPDVDATKISNAPAVV